MGGVKPSVKVGDVFESSKGGKYRIIEYNNYHDVLIEFIDEYKFSVRTTVTKIKKGEIKNPFTRIVFNKGFFGVGRYVARKGSSRKHKATKEYLAWINMLSRCYYDKYIVRAEGGKSYDNVVMCPEWHNFQVFAEWYVSNHPDYSNEDEKYSVDKELIHVDGSKIYSPDTCFIIPQSINSMLRLGSFKKYPENPCGIHRQQDGTYRLYIENDSGVISVKDLSLREALDLRYQTKKLKLLEKVKEYEHVLPERTLAALYAFDYTREYDYSSIPKD